MGCVSNYDVCIIRGDTFKLDIGLSAAYDEVLLNPTGYEASMVFREDQDDATTPYLTLTATPEVNPDPLPDEVPIYFRFLADTTQTQALPDWDIVHYVELYQVAGASPEVTRLFEGDVEIHD